MSKHMGHRIAASHFASGTFVLAAPPVKVGLEVGQDLSVFMLENVLFRPCVGWR